MIVYHSALRLNSVGEELIGKNRLRLLNTYASSNPGQRPSYCSGLFLDSGAFSAFQSKQVIRIEDYIEFLKLHEKEFDIVAGLDVIWDAEASMVNQLKMKAAEISCIPTYHIGEPIKYLEYYVDNYEYIALGGMARSRRQNKSFMHLLDDCWTYISRRAPSIKVHGFGLTDLVIGISFPWTSVDSTTATRAGRTGVLLSPWGQLAISTGIKNPKHHGAHIVTDLQIKAVVDWLTTEFPDIPVTWEQLSDPCNKKADQYRTVFNALFIERELAKKAKPIKQRRGMFA